MRDVNLVTHQHPWYKKACFLRVKLCDGDMLLFCCLYRIQAPNSTSDKIEATLNFLSRYMITIYLPCFLEGTLCVLYIGINWSTRTTPCNKENKEASFQRPKFFNTPSIKTKLLRIYGTPSNQKLGN